MTEDTSFSLPMKMEGTTIFADTYTPNAQELDTCPHIVLSSHGEWDPSTVRFSQSSRFMEEEMSHVRTVGGVGVEDPHGIGGDDHKGDFHGGFNISVRRISMKHCYT